jgi:hypothetical protein
MKLHPGIQHTRGVLHHETQAECPEWSNGGCLCALRTRRSALAILRARDDTAQRAALKASIPEGVVQHVEYMHGLMVKALARRSAARKKAEAVSACRACGASIRWRRTQTGKATPVNLDGTSHWESCSNPAKFRRGSDNAK